MNVEVAGEVLAEAVIADELGRTGEGSKVHSHQNCANCNAPLSGRFCNQCGQSGHVHRSLLHMFEEFLHGIFHFDTKAWRTLPALAFHPGRLTRAYIDGQRARHVSPLALFLFMVFVMVMVFSFTSSTDDITVRSGEGARGRITKKIEIAREKKKEFEVEASQAAASSPKQARLESKALDQQRRIETMEKALKALEVEAAASKDGSGEGKEATRAIAEAKAEEAEVMDQLSRNLPWLANPYMAKKLAHAVNNPELALYKIKGAASKFAILLMPIALPFLWLLFPFSRRFSMFDHAVFSLYSLSFMAGLMTLLALLGTLGFGALVGLLVILAPPAHMFAQLRGTYGLSKAGALWRTIALLFVALTSLLIYGLLVVFVSM